MQNNADTTVSSDDINQLNSGWAQCDTEDEQGNKIKNGDGNLNKNELSAFLTKLMTDSKSLYNSVIGFLRKTPESLDSLKSATIVDEENGVETYYNEEGGISRIVNKKDGTDFSYETGYKDGQVSFEYETNKPVNGKLYNDKGQLECVSENGKDMMYTDSADGKRVLAMVLDNNAGTTTMYRDDGSIYSIENPRTKITEYYDVNNNVIVTFNDNYSENPNDAKAVANNLRLLCSYVISADINQQKGLKDMMAIINPDNYSEIANESADYNLDSNIFTKFVTFYNGEDKNEILIEKFQMFLEQAKKKNVYTKDFEEKFERFKNDSGKLAQVLQTLCNRIERSNFVRNASTMQPNGEIDAAFEQGYTGDCWLIASIVSIKNNPEMKSKLDDMINVTYEADNSTVKEVSVTIKGNDYKISAEELNGAIEYSTGDLDVRALEIAVNRYCLENDISDINEGGLGKNAFEILFDGAVVQSFENVTDENFDILRRDNVVAVTRGVDAEDITLKSGFTGRDSTGNSVNIVTSHAYSISKVDENNVYLINPWASEEIIQMSIEDFKQAFNGFDYVTV